MTADRLNEIRLAFAKQYAGGDAIVQVFSRNDVGDLLAALSDAERQATQAEEERERYRIEADCGLRDFDALELRYGKATDVLRQIAEKRPNRSFDPWAVELVRAVLADLAAERGTSG